MNGEGGSYIEHEDGSLKLVSQTKPAKTKTELAELAASAEPAEPAPIAGKPVSQTKPKKETAE